MKSKLLKTISLIALWLTLCAFTGEDMKGVIEDYFTYWGKDVFFLTPPVDREYVLHLRHEIIANFQIETLSAAVMFCYLLPSVVDRGRIPSLQLE